jgi:hypothetical protein
MLAFTTEPMECVERRSRDRTSGETTQIRRCLDSSRCHLVFREVGGDHAYRRLHSVQRSKRPRPLRSRFRNPIRRSFQSILLLHSVFKCRQVGRAAIYSDRATPPGRRRVGETPIGPRSSDPPGVIRTPSRPHMAVSEASERVIIRAVSPRHPTRRHSGATQPRQ